MREDGDPGPLGRKVWAICTPRASGCLSTDQRKFHRHYSQPYGQDSWSRSQDKVPLISLYR